MSLFAIWPNLISSRAHARLLKNSYQSAPSHNSQTGDFLPLSFFLLKLLLFLQTMAVFLFFRRLWIVAEELVVSVTFLSIAGFWNLYCFCVGSPDTQFFINSASPAISLCSASRKSMNGFFSWPCAIVLSLISGFDASLIPSLFAGSHLHVPCNMHLSCTIFNTLRSILNWCHW